MDTIQAIPKTQVLAKISQRLALIDAAACRGIEGEIGEPSEVFSAILDATEAARRDLAVLRSLPSSPDEPAMRDREAMLRSLRTAAAAATTAAVRRAIWDEGADIDELVDGFARTHETPAYRSPELQKDAVDRLAEEALNTLEGDTRKNLQDLLDRWYSRFLLSADVGFELGFAAATSLVRGGCR